MADEKWKVDRHGFNVVEDRADGSATVAVLQPHERIKERARLIAAAPDLRDTCNGLLGLFELIWSRLPADLAADIEDNHRIIDARAALAKAESPQ